MANFIHNFGVEIGSKTRINDIQVNVWYFITQIKTKLWSFIQRK